MTNRNSKEEVTRDIDFITEIVEHTKDDILAAREKLRNWQHELLEARIDIEREGESVSGDNSGVRRVEVQVDRETCKKTVRAAINDIHRRLENEVGHLPIEDFAKINKIVNNVFKKYE